VTRHPHTRSRTVRPLGSDTAHGLTRDFFLLRGFFPRKIYFLRARTRLTSGDHVPEVPPPQRFSEILPRKVDGVTIKCCDPCVRGPGITMPLIFMMKIA
jgi:hypothetical protein